MPRLINCRGCGSRHIGAGGSRCQFLKSQLIAQTGSTMASAEMIPDRDSPNYQSYLESKIQEQEELLKQAEETAKVASLEKQLSELRIKTERLHQVSDDRSIATVNPSGFAGCILVVTAQQDKQQTASLDPQQSRAEKEIVSKLRPSFYMSESKPPEKTTYRDFIHGMTKVLQFILEVAGSATGYAAHMSFIASKAAGNYFVTDALIKYELAVTDKVISGTLQDWVAADPESVAIHLGADATYAVRGGNKPAWGRSTSGVSGNTRDFSDWPRDICWLYNNTACYFPKCRRSHLCSKCRKTRHTQKECKLEDSASIPINDDRRPKATQNEAPKK